VKRHTQPRPPTLDARDKVLLIGICEWLIDTLWCTLDETVDVVHDAESNDHSAAIDTSAPETAPVDDDKEPF